MNEKELLGRLERLHINKKDGHERPHKPSMLFAIIVLFEKGVINENKLLFSPELLELYDAFFKVMKKDDDSRNVLDPFWRLKSDKLLFHKAIPGMESVVDRLSSVNKARDITELTSYSQLDDTFYRMLRSKTGREEIKETLIARYVSNQPDAIRDVFDTENKITNYQMNILELEKYEVSENISVFVRDSAFRRLVCNAWDYRCAACGMGLRVDAFSVVEACHLIPWSETHNDHPSNGISLCRNHHWAMDNLLIAPTKELTWKVSKKLDERDYYQKELMNIANKELFSLPRKDYLIPSIDALSWREKSLS